LAGGPLHGYDLKAAYEGELVPESSLNFGQVYTNLDRLHRDGLVSEQVVVQSERPDRKVYSLTEAGRRELDVWLGSPTHLDRDLRNESFLKIAVARRLARLGTEPASPAPQQILAAERRECLERLHEVAGHLADAEKEGAALETRLLLELAVLRLDAFHKWLERCEELLGQQTEGRP
jgi:DNA-binding PadR family transcriptional regulator